jgi:NAD(P)-dependent dehydrogenase (short-subunit alcohol dehydrogenase family)
MTKTAMQGRDPNKRRGIDTGELHLAAAGHHVYAGNAGLNGLVNNAGIGVFGPLAIIPIQQFRRHLEVNVTGQLAVI